MKSIGLYVGMFAFLMLTACDKKEEKSTDTVENNTVETKTIEKETVIVKDTVNQTKEDGTSVKVSSDGVKVDSKDVDVEVKK